MSKPKEERPKIAICVPMGGNISAAWFMSFVLAMQEWSEDNRDIQIVLDAGVPVDRSRNSLVKRAITGGADYIFFIDSDVLLPKGALKELLDADKDIINGIYFMKGEPYRPVLRRFEDGVFFFWDKEIPDKNFKINGCGMGCCLIKAEVFKKLEYPWFKFEWYNWRGQEEQGSEDLFFCRLLTKSGFDIWASPNVLCAHHGGKVDVKNYLMFEPAINRLKEERVELINDIMKYTGNNDYYDVVSKIRMGCGAVKKEWEKAKPKTPEEIKQFYKNAKNYIYDLTNWHISGRRDFDDRLVQDMIVRVREENPPKKVLDFGCGIAQNAIMISKYVREIDTVVAADLKSYTLDFARHRIEEHNYNVEIWETDKEPDKYDGEKFDIILCFDILEHLPDKEFWKTLKLLEKLMVKDGQIFITATFGETDIHPMHVAGSDKKVAALKKLAGIKDE